MSLPALGAASALRLGAAADDARKPCMRPAICAYSYRNALAKKTMTYEDVVRRAVEFNADGIDMTVYWFPNTSDEFLFPLKRFAYRNAVDIYSIAVRTEMTQATPDAQAAQLEDIRKWLDVAEKLGARHIRVFGGRVPKGATEDQAAGWVIEVLKRASDLAARKGIILGIENHGGVTENASTILKIVKAVDSPWVGINLDTGNFVRNGYDQMQMCIPYAVNFQVKTEIRGANGQSEPCDWERVLKMAAASGYRGYLAIEYEAKEDPATAMPRLLRELRTLTTKYSA